MPQKRNTNVGNFEIEESFEINKKMERTRPLTLAEQIEAEKKRKEELKNVPKKSKKELEKEKEEEWLREANKLQEYRRKKELQGNRPWINTRHFGGNTMVI